MFWYWLTIVVLVLVIATIAPGYYLAKTAKADVKHTLIPSYRTNPTTAFVHYPGLVGDGWDQIANILPTFRERGDLIAVHYDGSLRKAATKFDTVLVECRMTLVLLHVFASRKYSNVVFVGTSMGAKLAYRQAQILKIVFGHQTKAILIDAPWNRDDLYPIQKYGGPVLRFIPHVPFLNLTVVFSWAGRLLLRPLLPGPKESSIEATLTEDERDNLDNSVRLSRQTRLPFYLDQVEVVLNEPDDEYVSSPWEYKDVVFFRSANDTDVVRETARDSWELPLGFLAHLFIVKGAKHAAYGENPTPYRRALPRAFDWLGV